AAQLLPNGLVRSSTGGGLRTLAGALDAVVAGGVVASGVGAGAGVVSTVAGSVFEGFVPRGGGLRGAGLAPPTKGARTAVALGSGPVSRSTLGPSPGRVD